jgi:hypothetical protein
LGLKWQNLLNVFLIAFVDIGLNLIFAFDDEIEVKF